MDKASQKYTVDRNSVRSVLKTAIQRLTLAKCDTPTLDAEILLAHTLNQNRTWLFIHPNTPLDNQQVASFFKLVTQRQQRKPVAYITGHKEFFALDFLVTPNVLIPRPETELLVETALQLATQYTSPSIIDVGTGSGCIAVSLAKHVRQAVLYAVDISDQALAVAHQNAARHQLLSQITFLHGNLLNPVTKQVDMVVSNPPYISQKELQSATIMPEVRNYEPRPALDGGPTGLYLVKQLLEQATEKLNKNGSLLVEIGFQQGESVLKLAKSYFPNAVIEIKKDLAKLDRLLVVKNLH